MPKKKNAFTSKQLDQFSSIATGVAIKYIGIRLAYYKSRVISGEDSSGVEERPRATEKTHVRSTNVRDNLATEANQRGEPSYDPMSVTLGEDLKDFDPNINCPEFSFSYSHRYPMEDVLTELPSVNVSSPPKGNTPSGSKEDLQSSTFDPLSLSYGRPCFVGEGAALQISDASQVSCSSTSWSLPTAENDSDMSGQTWMSHDIESHASQQAIYLPRVDSGIQLEGSHAAYCDEWLGVGPDLPEITTMD